MYVTLEKTVEYLVTPKRPLLADTEWSSITIPSDGVKSDAVIVSRTLNGEVVVNTLPKESAVEILMYCSDRIEKYNVNLVVN